MDQITEGLLVAFMFILILSMGVGSILVACAGLVDRRADVKVHWLPLAWTVILLLMHLSLFWNTLDILLVEEWGFGEFVFVTAGPVILYLAAGAMVPQADCATVEDSLAQYFNAARLVFALLVLLALWSIATQYFLLGKFLQSPFWEVLDIAVLVVLMLSRKTGVHAVCAALYSLLLLGYYVPLGLG